MIFLEVLLLIVVVVDILYNKLLALLEQELLETSIGYMPNKSRLGEMTTLVQVIDYVENARPSDQEILGIIQYYEES